MPTTRTSRFHPGFSLPPSQPPRPACPLLSQTCLGPVPAHVAPHCSPSSHSHRVRQTTLLAIEAHTPRLTSRPAPRFLSKCTSCPAVRVLMPQDAERDTLLSRHQRTENPGGGRVYCLPLVVRSSTYQDGSAGGMTYVSSHFRLRKGR